MEEVMLVNGYRKGVSDVDTKLNSNSNRHNKIHDGDSIELYVPKNHEALYIHQQEPPHSYWTQNSKRFQHLSLVANLKVSQRL